jgi:hypothetical protein
MSWWDECDKYLWQAMGKENFDINNKVTDKQWADFVEAYADVFAEMASELANELWLDWLDENPDIQQQTEQEEEE